MKFLSITGPKADIDRVVNTYLSKYEIHLENALTELSSVRNITPYIQINPYKETLKQADDFVSLLPEDLRTTDKKLSLEDAINCIHELDFTLKQLNKERADLEAKKKEDFEKIIKLAPFQELQFNLRTILNFRFIRFRFGKIAKEYFEKFENYVYDNSNTLFCRCHSDDQYVWGIYFCPKDTVDKVDAVFSSLHFERIYLPDDCGDTPEDAYLSMKNSLSTTAAQLKSCETKMQETLREYAPNIIAARKTLTMLSENFDVRKLAACTKSNREIFYILCGWMTEKDAASFQKDIENDANLFCFIEDDDNNVLRTPPTKLKNPKLFRPFEMYVKMYGLPAYNELDPTIFVSLTYAFIFGAMFGDVGQGLCLLIGGALLYHFKKMDLAAIISMAGIFSTIFGFLFGSFFGFEEILPAIWLKPKEAMTTLPLVGKLNTVFVVAIAFGMFLILTTMVLHIINAVKAHRKGDIWFSQNSVAGFIFYGCVVVTILLFMTGNAVPAAGLLVVFIGLPLVAIFLKEPLEKWVEKKGKLMPEEGPVMFFVQSFFEMFEIMLSFFSNTLSFVRIGAFAVSHAAMMEVVLMLAGAAEGGSPNWIVIVLGNIFVCAMEGLIVGIQVLRLEYYEMFSRFYSGDGREFQPFLKKDAGK